MASPRCLRWPDGHPRKEVKSTNSLRPLCLTHYGVNTYYKITNTPSTNELRNESVWILVIWRWSRISGLCGLVVRTFVTRIDTRLRGYGGRGFESRQWPSFSHIFKVLFGESNLELNISKFILNFQIYRFSTRFRDKLAALPKEILKTNSYLAPTNNKTNESLNFFKH